MLSYSVYKMYTAHWCMYIAICSKQGLEISEHCIPYGDLF